MTTIHATCVLVRGIGVLLRGPSGSGKSDVALRLIDQGAQLVADDQVALSGETGRVMAAAPAVLAGLLEVRGLGIMTVPVAASVPIGLVVDLVDGGEVERLPEPRTVELLGVAVPALSLAAFEASTPAKLRLAAASLGASPAKP